MTSSPFPALYCPFPSAMSPHAMVVQLQTLEWVRRHALISGADAYRRFNAARFGWLAARAYPAAPLAPLQIIADWNAWLFIRDDLCDETGLGSQPLQLAQMNTNLLAVLRSGLPATQPTPLAAALNELWTRLTARVDCEWMARFIASVEDYFTATVWEATNRAQGKVPSLAAYVAQRPFTGGLYSDVVLIEIAEQQPLPAAIREHPDLQQLIAITNNVVCWANDILSLEKEARSGDVHNLVIVLQHERQCSQQAALQAAIAMHNAEVQRFVRLESRLPSFGTQDDKLLRSYVRVLRCWMRGNLDWAHSSQRYRRTSCAAQPSWHAPHPAPALAMAGAHLER